MDIKALSSTPLSRVTPPQVASATAPVRSAGAAAIEPGDLAASPAYISPILHYDNAARIAVLAFRDHQTGEVTNQFPPEKVVAEYRRAGGRQEATPASESRNVRGDPVLRAATQEAAQATAIDATGNPVSNPATINPAAVGGESREAGAPPKVFGGGQGETGGRGTDGETGRPAIGSRGLGRELVDSAAPRSGTAGLLPTDGAAGGSAPPLAVGGAGGGNEGGAPSGGGGFTPSLPSGADGGGSRAAAPAFPASGAASSPGAGSGGAGSGSHAGPRLVSLSV